MKLTATNQIELSRRNLVTLLWALDSGLEHPVLSRHDGEQFMQVRVVADADHYTDRDPGPMPEAATAAMVVQA